MRAEADEGEKIELSLEQRQVALLALGALLLLGVVFALGVMVGRQLASAALASPAQPPPGDLRALDAEKPPPHSAPQLVVSATNPPAPAPAAPVPAPARVANRPAPAPAHPAMPVHTGNSPAVVAEGRGEHDDEAHSQASPPTPDELQENDDDEAAEVKVAAPEGTAVVDAPGKPVTVAAPKDPNQAPLPPPPEHLGKFTVQFGSTQDRRDAERLEARAKALGLKPYIVAAHLGAKGTWYRLRAGAFASHDEAVTFEKDIDRELHVKSAVMPTAESPGK